MWGVGRKVGDGKKHAKEGKQGKLSSQYKRLIFIPRRTFTEDRLVKQVSDEQDDNRV